MSSVQRRARPQFRGDVAITRAVATAATAVREEHDTVAVVRQGKVSEHCYRPDLNRYRARTSGRPNALSHGRLLLVHIARDSRRAHRRLCPVRSQHRDDLSIRDG
jgi:hypothetical protein